MNVPVKCSTCLLLPAHVKIDELIQHQIDPNIKLLYSEELDKVYDDHNMAVIVSLLNYVCTKLVCNTCYISVSISLFNVVHVQLCIYGIT